MQQKPTRVITGLQSVLTELWEQFLIARLISSRQNKYRCVGKTKWTFCLTSCRDISRGVRNRRRSERVPALRSGCIRYRQTLLSERELWVVPLWKLHPSIAVVNGLTDLSTFELYNVVSTNRDFTIQPDRIGALNWTYWPREVICLCTESTSHCTTMWCSCQLPVLVARSR